MATFEQSLALDLHLPITSWLEDESFYSLCARHHYVSGNASAGRTAQQLFGHYRNGTQHDFPSRLHVFAQRTGNLFGNPEEIIRTRTVLPFFLPWKSHQDADDLVTMLSQGNASKIKSLLGLPASRMRAHMPLKACPQCMQEDQQRAGVSYWRVTHQLPGVWICPDHYCPLLESINKSNGVGRFLWVIPKEHEFYEPADARLDACVKTQLLRLAELAIAVFHLPANTHFLPSLLHQTYRRALMCRNLTRGQNQIALDEVTCQYQDFIHGFQLALPEINATATSNKNAAQTVSRLLHRKPRPTHPLRHLLMILWLFERWDTFMATYLNVKADLTLESHSDAHPENNSSDVSVEISQAQFLQHIQTRKLTITQASTLTGITTQTGQAWASTAGIQIKRRSKLARSKVKAIIEDLNSGKDKIDIAHAHQVSVSTVTRLLRTEPQLQETWHRTRFTARQHLARKTWADAIAAHPNSNLKALRKRHPACYSWLYRNDREWLVRRNAQLNPHEPTKTTHIDWQARDIQLAQLVVQTQRDIEAKKPSSARITLQDLYQGAPQLKPFINKLDRLPLTSHAIETARRGNAFSNSYSNK